MHRRPRPPPVRPAQEARRHVAHLQRELAHLVQISARQADDLAACKGRLRLYADRSATIAECERLTAVLRMTERLLAAEQADHADTRHTLAAAVSILQEMGGWVKASTSDTDLLVMFYRAWGVTRPPPVRSVPPE